MLGGLSAWGASEVTMLILWGTVTMFCNGNKFKSLLLVNLIKLCFRNSEAIDEIGVYFNAVVLCYPK